MIKQFILAILFMAVGAVSTVGGETLSFIEKPQQLNTGDIGKGTNHYRPRWSPDGKWLSFELIDDQSLRTFVIVPAKGDRF
jgi:hypothetical protein